jgi:hypothetical protein
MICSRTALVVGTAWAVGRVSSPPSSQALTRSTECHLRAGPGRPSAHDCACLVAVGSGHCARVDQE